MGPSRSSMMRVSSDGRHKREGAGLNPIDLCCLAAAALALGWGASSYRLMRQPLPRITSIEPNTIVEGHTGWLTLRGEHFRYARVVIIGNGMLIPREVTDTSLRVFFEPAKLNLPADVYAARVLNGWGRGETRLSAVEVSLPHSSRMVEFFASILSSISPATARSPEVQPKLQSLLVAIDAILDDPASKKGRAVLRSLKRTITEQLARFPSSLEVREAFRLIREAAQMMSRLLLDERETNPILKGLQRVISEKLTLPPEGSASVAGGASTAAEGQLELEREQWVEVKGWICIPPGFRSPVRVGDSERDAQGNVAASILWAGTATASDNLQVYRGINFFLSVDPLPQAMRQPVVLRLLALQRGEGGEADYQGEHLDPERHFAFRTSRYQVDVRLMDRPRPWPVTGGHAHDFDVDMDLKVAPGSRDLMEHLRADHTLANQHGDTVAYLLERFVWTKSRAMIVRLRVPVVVRQGTVWLQDQVTHEPTEVQRGRTVKLETAFGPLVGTVLNEIRVSREP